MIKVFTLNKNGKIELTEKELKQLLDNLYWEGYRDNNKSWTYRTPSPLTYPYYSTITTTNLNTTTAKDSNLTNTITTDSITLKSK